MGLVCGTHASFVPAAAARTALATTITPALGAGVAGVKKTKKNNKGLYLILTESCLQAIRKHL